MRTKLIAVVAALALNQAAAQAEEAYDLIFKTETLSDVSTASVLVYDRNVVIAADPDRAARNTGSVNLTFEPDDMARLTFFQDGKHRGLGQFPASVGNPVVMYFVETVLRDVAHQAGGSPFYIRNRIKDALVQEADIHAAQFRFDGRALASREVTLHPFENDENRERMKGYGDLALTFTMSEEIPGWYGSLVAKVPGESDETPLYTNALTLQAVETTQ
ncbi:hypothetical protein [Sedimentitalea arenosa]|uniref:Uncharacterized protein n=1 Tax=Sedimentitalea arenosa TaxID=2798803 RepID=A0A8J7J8N8_9RHOB|nr:hypothetical protein [Arenibacterium arenosum]MBJ6373325.1 hypothetical protein [Arenibacterium arenosum]